MYRLLALAFLILSLSACDDETEQGPTYIQLSTDSAFFITPLTAFVKGQAYVNLEDYGKFNTPGLQISEVPDFPALTHETYHQFIVRPVTREVRTSGEYHFPLSYLKPETVYYVRIVAHSPWDEIVYNGETFQFTTSTAEIFTDPRDGKTYASLVYGGTQWMIENLDFEAPGSAYYDSDPSTSGDGRLYDWQSACTSCPEGWILPSDSDWQALEQYFGIPADSLGLNGYRGDVVGKTIVPGTFYLSWEQEFKKGPLYLTNRSGFSILPSGVFYSDNNYYWDKYYFTGFWSSTPSDSLAFARIIRPEKHPGIKRTPANIKDKFSVRCIKRL